MRIRIVAAAGISAALWAGQAWAQAPAAPARPSLSESLTGEAKAEYEGGKILLTARDYEAALVKFEHAYSLSKDPRLLWNAAICQKELRRYSRMLRTIERYLSEGAAVITEQDKERAAEIIKTVQAFISPLKLTVSEEGASVFVDGEQVGTTPLRRVVLLDVGRRTVRVSKAGFRDTERSVTVIGARDVALDLQLWKEVHRGKLTVTAGPRDFISIDGKMVAQGRYEGSLPSGGHTLLVSADGMAPQQSEIVIQDNQARSINVALNPQPEPSDPSKWLWLVGGAAILGGAAVVGALVYKPNEGVPGTINAVPIPLSFSFSLGGGR